MRRARAAKSQTSVSLFPFLAVLVCTMGALIVLLVLVVKQARVQADTIAQDRVQQDTQRRATLEDLETERDDFQWQQDILQQQRSEITDQLSEKRLELSHLEEHIRRLDERWRRMQTDARQLDNLKESSQVEQSAAQRELERFAGQIQIERERLAQLRDEFSRRKKTYSIIPYAGPNGTRRRPIYVECRASEIVIQPEGVSLSPADFSGPLGPGNPLDAALRAVREHWSRASDGGRSGEPYPLLIVRPDGAVAYSMARAAMAAWDDAFGYELIDEETELAYPKADPRLRETLDAVIRAARHRQELLAAAMPSRYGTSAPDTFALPDRYEEASGAGGGSRFAAEGRGPGGYAANGDGTGEGTAAGSMGTGPDGEPIASSQPPYHGQAGNQAAANGEYGSAPASGQPAAGSDQAGGAGSAAGESDAASGQNGAAGASIDCMAATKGRNWALPDSNAESTGISRPIVVQCHVDRLVIESDSRNPRQVQVVPLAGATRNSMERFVAAVWTRMESWGMAVAGGYWKPVLRVEVHPGAEARFHDMQALLAGSGIEIERR